MVDLNLSEKRELIEIKVTTFLYDRYKEEIRVNGLKEHQYYIEEKTIPYYIKIETQDRDNKKSFSKTITFDLDNFISAFNTVYNKADYSNLSLISIQIDEKGKVIEPITLTKDNKQVEITIKNID